MRKILVTLGLITVGNISFGQTPIRLGYYLDHDYYQNAASTQIDSAKWSVNFYGQHKFLTEKNPTWHKAPQFMIDAHLNVKDIGTFSAMIANDDYSYFNRTTIAVGYSARYEKNGWFLQPGFRIVGNIDNYNLSKIYIPGQTHTDRNKTSLLADLDFGLVMGWKKLQVQVAYNNLSKSELEIERYTILSNKPHWMVNFKYQFDLGDKWELTPFLQMYNERTNTYDIGLQTGMKNNFKFGYQLRLISISHIYHASIQATKGLQIRLAVGHSSIYPDINAQLGLSFKMY